MNPFKDTVIDYYEKTSSDYPDETSLDPMFGFAIPGMSASADMQKTLIEITKLGGRRQGGTYGHLGQKFWTSLILRTIDRSSLPEAVRDFDNSKLEFFYRQRPEIRWEWIDNEATAMVRELVKPVERLFTKLTRVKIFLQVPGLRTPMHKDLVAGNFYKVKGPYTYLRGHTFVKHLGDEALNKLDPAPDTAMHRKQGYFALKIPLTEIAGDYGKQVIITKKPYFYFHGGNYYFLNEACWHGAEASPFYRGVIFVDGLMDMEAVRAIDPLHLSLKPYDFRTEGRIRPAIDPKADVTY